MKELLLAICLLAMLGAAAAAEADELTRIIQKDLVVLGYDPGNIQGELTTETTVAISKFQAENDLPVTGEPTPQLAGVIKAKISARDKPAGQAAGAPAAANDPAALQAAQQACIQEKIAAAQATQKKKRGFGSLMSAVSRTASRFGGSAAQDIARTTSDVYGVNATAADLSQAAEDLGLTENDLEECRNPGP